MRHHGCQQQLTCCQSVASHATGREDLPCWPPSPVCGQDAQQHLQEKPEDPQTFPTDLSSPQEQSLQTRRFTIETPGTKQPTGLKVRVALGDKQALSPGWAVQLKYSYERARHGHLWLHWLTSGCAAQGYLTLTYFRIFFTRDMHRIVTQMDTTEPKKSQYCSVS